MLLSLLAKLQMKFDIRILRGFLALGLLLHVQIVSSEALPEFRLKTAFLYNFVAFTEWPNDIGATINLCVHGQSPLGEEIEALSGRSANERHITIQRESQIENLKGCQVIFITSSAVHNLSHVLDSIKGQPALTVSDSKGAISQGVMINMSIEKDKIVFEVNLAAARRVGLNISSQLLRLAKEVSQ